MFSGIVEEFATVRRLVREQGNLHLTLTCSFVNELKIDQSVSHNGVCLTVVDINGDEYTVTAMHETLERSNIGLLNVGDKVNVERSMMMNGRLDGHIVQGHVDCKAQCVSVRDMDGSWYYTFRYKSDAGRQGVGNGKRCQPYRVRTDGRFFLGGYNTLYSRTYEFPHNRGGYACEY